MIAQQLISQSVPPLKTSDDGQKALNWMSDFQVRHLPIVEQGKFVGLISENDLLDHNNLEVLIKDHPLSLKSPQVHANEHIYEVIKTAVNQQLSVIPVVDETMDYIGGITLQSLLSHFAQSTALIEPGGIIVLEIQKRNYSLAEIARIVESEGALILSTLISSYPDSPVLEITLKINKQQLDAIIATFERFEYTIKASYQESDYFDNLQDRYDALMNYLNI